MACPIHTFAYVYKSYPEVLRWGRNKNNHECANSLHLLHMALLGVLGFMIRRCKSVGEKFWTQTTTLKYLKASHLASLMHALI